MSPQTSQPTFARRAFGRIVTMLVTGVTLAGAGAAVVFGADLLMARAAATQPQSTAEATPVQVQPLQMDTGFETARRFLGQVEPAQTADLSFELGGKVVEILVDEGHSVAQGDVLARLDTSLIEAERQRLEASRAALVAELDFAEASVTRRAALKERGFSPTEQFDQARSTRDALVARIAQTDAAIATTQLQLEKSVLIAPFDGQIGLRQIDTGTTVAAGQGVVQLLENGAVRVRIGLPVWADVSALEAPKVEIAGQDWPARVISVRADVDAATRTRTVLLEVDTTDPLVLGQTAILTVTRKVDAPGAWVPVRALREGAQGVWTVFVVDDDSRVRPAAVELIHAEAEMAYVRGTFSDGSLLIRSGPHRVIPGQLVRVSEAR